MFTTAGAGAVMDMAWVTPGLAITAGTGDIPATTATDGAGAVTGATTAGAGVVIGDIPDIGVVIMASLTTGTADTMVTAVMPTTVPAGATITHHWLQTTSGDDLT